MSLVGFGGPGCQDFLLINNPLVFELGERTSELSLGVALPSVDGETLIPFCVKGLVGEGDLDVLYEPGVKRVGVLGLVKPRRRPKPLGNELNAGSIARVAMRLVSIVVNARGGGRFSVGRLSGRRFESSLLPRLSSANETLSTGEDFSVASSSSELSDLIELPELFEDLE